MSQVLLLPTNRLEYPPLLVLLFSKSHEVTVVANDDSRKHPCMPFDSKSPLLIETTAPVRKWNPCPVLLTNIQETRLSKLTWFRISIPLPPLPPKMQLPA